MPKFGKGGPARVFRNGIKGIVKTNHHNPVINMLTLKPVLPSSAYTVPNTINVMARHIKPPRKP